MVRSTFVGIVGAACLMLVVSGCSGGPQAAPVAPAGGSGQRVTDVGSVVVTVGSSIPADKKTVLDEVNGKVHLRAAVEGAATKAGKFKNGSKRVLEVVITDFRLRSGASVYFGGMMTGADSLSVQVTVREGKKVLSQFQAEASSMGVFAGLSSEGRFTPLSSDVANQVAQQL